mgnify:CR=1 FL=1
MNEAEPALATLVDALRRLPGVGVRSAQRITWHLLQHDRDGAKVLARALSSAAEQVGHCDRCHTFTQSRTCGICSDATRDRRQLCVIESPADQAAMERTGTYRGQYFVLMGRVSPLEGAGLDALGLGHLMSRLDDDETTEVILATNFTGEGEATDHALGEVMRARGIKVTRLARGVPAGSELEYVDLGTIAHALADRR